MGDWYLGLGPLWLTLELAFITTSILLLIGTPIAYWLAFTRSRTRPLIEVLVAMPLVLPPTVLGFYLLIFFRPNGFVGSLWHDMTNQSLLFSFSGLVIASVIYSLPFVVQPLQNSFVSVGRSPLEKAATMGLARASRILKVLIPQAKRGYITAAVLGFTHTVGEFGVVLMVGGNIPRETRVVSIAIYDLVETSNFAKAHTLSGVVALLSFLLLLLVFTVGRVDKDKGVEHQQLP
ncbi:molybdate ABC transporter permease subunit [Luminiphilus sp.]|nr:molybdate ABC transporter permease subunit [Luminiphilus sp.]